MKPLQGHGTQPGNDCWVTPATLAQGTGVGTTKKLEGCCPRLGNGDGRPLGSRLSSAQLVPHGPFSYPQPWAYPWAYSITRVYAVIGRAEASPGTQEPDHPASDPSSSTTALPCAASPQRGKLALQWGRRPGERSWGQPPHHQRRRDGDGVGEGHLSCAHFLSCNFLNTVLTWVSFSPNFLSKAGGGG